MGGLGSLAALGSYAEEHQVRWDLYPREQNRTSSIWRRESERRATVERDACQVCSLQVCAVTTPTHRNERKTVEHKVTVGPRQRGPFMTLLASLSIWRCGPGYTSQRRFMFFCELVYFSLFTLVLIIEGN